MARNPKFVPFLIALATIAACAGPDKRPLIDPFPLSFPPVVVGTLEVEGHVAGQPWAKDGVVHYRTREGTATAVVASSGAVLWRSAAGRPDAGLAGPGGGPMLARDRDRLRAYDDQGQQRWEFQARGILTVDAVRSGSRIFFGDETRTFYSLGAGKGKVRWRRRLQGAPVHPAVVGRRAVFVAGANSVVYVLSRRGGSILSWEPVASRLLFPPVAAGNLVLVSSASPTVIALDLETGKRVGRYEAPGPLVAGPVWSSPYAVLFVEDEATGRQKVVLLRSR